MKLNGKVAWVVGASSGIGAAVARELVRRGATVAISARRKEQLHDVAGGRMLVLPADVTDAAAKDGAERQNRLGCRASSGIGAAVARELARRGGTVAISARVTSTPRGIGRANARRATRRHRAASVAAAAARVQQELGPIDLAVLSAG